MLRVEPVLAAEIPVKDIDAVAITSARSVDAVAGRPQWERLRKLPLFAVGEKSAERARLAGALRVIAGGGTIETLADRIAAEGCAAKVLYLAGSERSGDLVGDMKRRGLDCWMVEVYNSRTVTDLPGDAVKLLKAGRIDCILVYSRRTADALAAALDRIAPLSGLRFACLSQNAGAPLAGRGRVEIAGRPDEEALLALL
jgi:uroporphyrinogen-III synthase